MNILLWVIQVVLAVVFVGAGITKASRPKEKLVPQLPWVEDFSASTVRFIGVVEILGGLGLLLPAVTGIAPILTPLAAAGLALVMVLAAITHIRRREPSAVAVNAVLFVLAIVVAVGRFGPYSGQA
jgi:uncharacterized membrane protein YphA (DoxX/SURF4 family)